MKKSLLAMCLTGLVAFTTRADLIYYESFAYSNGPTVLVSTNAGGTTNWFRHSGSASPSDSIIKNGHLEVASSSPGVVPRTDDIHRNFTTFTNTQTVLFASLTVNCTNLPPAVGTYFSHFFVSSTNFNCRVFAQAGALPGTWRLGVAGTAGAVSAVFPVDLAPNVDYQMVVQWDPVTSYAATIWVNPVASTDNSYTSSDPVPTPGTPVAFAFRQAGSFGNAFFNITNLAVATSWDEAATNVWSTNAVAPIVVTPPQSGTNFPGENVTLTALTAGQGLAGMDYLWLKDGNGIANPNGNSNILALLSVAVPDTGNYQIVATTPYGLSVTSSPAFIWVTNAPIPPIITSQPATNNSVFYHQTVSLHVVAIGPPALTYQWYYTNAPATGLNVSGADSDTLTISDVFTNDGTAGPYYVVVSNPNGNTTSRVATVTAVPPSSATIAFLRTLVDPVNFVATNSSLRWQATGVITTLTNLTTGDTASYYLQDGTAGINIFVTHGTFFRPNQGDIVTFVGWLSSFNSTLELEGDTNDLTTSFTIWSNNVAALPPQKAIPFSITNNLPFCETNLEGRVVMLTNVYFADSAGTVISTSANTAVVVTNDAGETFNVLFSSQDLDTAGQTLPAFARTVVGVFNQNLGNTATPRNLGYQVEVTRFADIVTDDFSLTAAANGSSSTVSWPAAPYSYAYSVRAAANPAGPYAAIATNLHFVSPAGSFTDTNGTAAQRYYRVTTP
jgi:hypothetical protein